LLLLLAASPKLRSPKPPRLTLLPRPLLLLHRLPLLLHRLLLLPLLLLLLPPPPTRSNSAQRQAAKQKADLRVGFFYVMSSQSSPAP
jgi:hypothetical protein